MTCSLLSIATLFWHFLLHSCWYSPSIEILPQLRKAAVKTVVQPTGVLAFFCLAKSNHSSNFITCTPLLTVWPYFSKLVHWFWRSGFVSRHFFLTCRVFFTVFCFLAYIMRSGLVLVRVHHPVKTFSDNFGDYLIRFCPCPFWYLKVIMFEYF